jgi:hypothetical protein
MHIEIRDVADEFAGLQSVNIEQLATPEVTILRAQTTSIGEFTAPSLRLYSDFNGV